MNLRLALTLGLAAVVWFGGTSAAQTSDADPCRDRGYDDNRFRFCEVREQMLPAGPLTVNAGRNGGIQVQAWNRNDIRVRAIVNTSARTEAEAKQLAAGVQVQASGGQITSSGPSAGHDEGWSVSFRIDVPTHTDLDLTANNGGVSISGVSGNIRFTTSNGGVRLIDLAGDVRGETRNGGVNVTLGGDRWDGTGFGRRDDQWRRHGRDSGWLQRGVVDANGQRGFSIGVSTHDSG